MKKIYLISSAMLFTTVVLLAQEQVRPSPGIVNPGSITYASHSKTSSDRAVSLDTTGVVNVTDFLPEFSSISGSYMWWWFGSGAKHAGYCFGNNKNNWNVWAQGYENVNAIPAKIIGIIAGFRKKEHDISSAPANSAVSFGIFKMADNKSCNTNGSGIYNGSVPNWPGPSGDALATATLLFSAIDTNVVTTRVFPYRVNYVPLSSPVTVTGSFAIAMNARATSATIPGTLAPGDTVGLITDIEESTGTSGDAANFDYAFTLNGSMSTVGVVAGTWIVADQWNSNAASPEFGSGAMDVNAALFAVFSNATGVDEFYNGIKLTTYPNPSIDKAIIEYTLEKSANKVTLSVFDEQGSKIVSNEYGSQASGTYKVDVDTRNLAAGMYFYQLSANGHTFTKQLIKVSNK
ncbi:MAG: T9SS type A sorting domain-containing protein [Bacteroidetes bacterium]|nr:T9SS type A sorting domain-containing protein [Bacteroidota bacterium]